MSRMRIALIRVKAFIPCDGFRLILALLRRDGHEVTVVSMPRHAPQACTEQELTQLGCVTAKADLILIGVYSAFSARAILVAKHLARCGPIARSCGGSARRGGAGSVPALCGRCLLRRGRRSRAPLRQRPGRDALLLATHLAAMERLLAAHEEIMQAALATRAD